MLRIWTGQPPTAPQPLKRPSKAPTHSRGFFFWMFAEANYNNSFFSQSHLRNSTKGLTLVTRCNHHINKEPEEQS